MQLYQRQRKRLTAWKLGTAHGLGKADRRPQPTTEKEQNGNRFVNQNPPDAPMCEENVGELSQICCEMRKLSGEICRKTVVVKSDVAKKTASAKAA